MPEDCISSDCPLKRSSLTALAWQESMDSSSGTCTQEAGGACISAAVLCEICWPNKEPDFRHIIAAIELPSVKFALFWNVP
jgi:hypothetical protein